MSELPVLIVLAALALSVLAAAWAVLTRPPAYYLTDAEVARYLAIQRLRGPFRTLAVSIGISLFPAFLETTRSITAFAEAAGRVEWVGKMSEAQLLEMRRSIEELGREGDGE